MTAAWAARLRRVRKSAWYLAAAVLVTMALVAVAAAQLALPWLERHPQAVAAWLGERAGRPVAFDTLDATWTRRGPLLRVTGLRIGDPAAAVPIGTAEIQVAQYSGLLPGRSLTELRLHGIELTLQRADDGSWQVRGLPGAAHAEDDPLDALQGLGELQVVDARLTVEAPSLSIAHTLPRVDLRLRVDRRRVRAAARAWVEADGAPLDLRLDLQRAQGDGRAYVAMPRNDLQLWSPLLAPSGVAIREGHGRVTAWIDLRARKVEAVTSEVMLDALSLQRADDVARAAGDAPTVAFEGASARVRWTHADGDWRLDAPRLRITQQGREQVLDGLVLAGGRHWAMQAGRVEVAPLLALAALGEGVPPSLRAWVRSAAPHAVLSDVAFAARAGGPVRMSARIEAFGFSPVGDRPGLDGLGGTLVGDGQGVVFRPDPDARPVFDWPAGFGVPHPLRLDGEIAGWRDGSVWRIQTPALRVEGEGYAADARGGLSFDGDGTRPRLDLAADVDASQIPVAKKFWVRHTMPVAAREWLDMALVAGTVRNGRGIVAGDLDDWPFGTDAGKDRRGVFFAEGDIADATVRFQHDWPAMTRLAGHIRFVNDGFRLDAATGKLAGVPVRDVVAGIRDYGQTPVEVTATAQADAKQLLALLRQSPLRAAHADTLDALDLAGPAEASVSLAVGHGAPMRLDGAVRLDGVAMRESRFDLAFDHVRGQLAFDQSGFHADALAAQQDGQAGTLALRAGPGHVRQGAHAFEGQLDMPLDASALLARAPDLAWLRPHVRGRAPWQVQVAVPGAPAADGAPAARLLLRSDLVGTTLRLPAPLDKPATRALRTTIEAPLPFGTGDVLVGFGNQLALRARTGGARAGIRVDLGRARVDAAAPAAGLVVFGRTPVVDVLDWIGLMGGGGDGDGPALQQVDVTTADLRLAGGRLGQTRITAARRDGGTDLRLDGAALAGDVRMPDRAGAPVSIALQRLHWPAPAPKPDAAATAPPTVPAIARVPASTPAQDTLDPAAVPPIELAIDDLRYGSVVLGRVDAASRRVPGGLAIERLQLRAPEHRIDVTGRWTGRGAAARTRLQADVESRNFGTLASGLGFAGSIVGGQGRVDFDAAWPGAPNAFQVAQLDGAMSIALRDGQLVEVEPGAGRVLGLLSVAELPRRLMLDFRDFFSKGFGFNRIAGDIRFGNGTARGENLVIDGPAAEIRIRGSADLAARTHDQNIEVLPKTGNLLPAVGALTLGPVGAAVGAVANAVLRKPLAEMGARNYHVSGPWQDPKVDVVERRDAAQPATAPTTGSQSAD
ncbi:YhdP family protein [Luteimonas sp. 9C]|uniref:YhdP family protein n=1 Tax=Luteimonas sp. 9C TaxID=2653148 RepID=UPI0013570308|nr:YhdP family protein [Luteimonas sp. 9C]